MRYILCLQKNVSGPSIGTLQPHREVLNRWFEPGDSSKSGAEQSTRRIDVFAINRVVVFSERSNAAAERGCSRIARKEYLTVLWVQWEGAVAYRQACGRIERETWGDLELEEIDLVLG